MSGTVWTKAELKRLRQSYSKKPEWVTDYEYAQLVAPTFKRSTEAVRWQFRSFHKPSVVKPPKILLLDIETLPIEALVWSTFKTTIYMEQVKKDWSVLCWAAKWLFDDEVMGQSVRPDEAMAHKDNSVLQRVWELMNEADVIIWHNGNEFDAKKLNWRFFVNGYPKPMYYQSIDTKKVVNDNFAPTYAKLDWVAQVLGIGRKVETDFKWWKECEAGSKKYLDMMLHYNKQDVHLEEEVYLKLRPWMDKHPNLGLYANHIGNSCPACGGNNLHWKGKYATALGLYQGFRCEDCGAIGRSTKKQYKLAQSEVQS